MYLWLFLLLVNIKCIIGQGCSSDFVQINRNGRGSLEGRILLPISVARSNSRVQLTVSFTIVDTAISSNGQLRLLYGKDEAMRQVESGSQKPLIYQVIFPYEASRIFFNEVIVNDQIYCRNSEVTFGSRSKITLTHTLFQIQSFNTGGNTWIRNPEPPDLEPELIIEQTTPRRNFGFGIGLGSDSFWPDTINGVPVEPSTRRTPPPTRWTPPPTQWTPPPTQWTPPPTRRTPPPTVNTPAPAQDNVEEDDQEICGTLVPSVLIANGQEYNRGDWPWLAALFAETPTGNNFFCGGSLVSSRFVVTAAHCFSKNDTLWRKEELVVILGKHRVRSLTERNIQIFSVNQYLIHEDYNSTSLFGDIAIIELSEEVKYDKYVRPLCIWRVSDDLSSVVGRVGTIAGWGRDENGSPITDTPKKVSVPIISNEQCRSTHSEFRKYVHTMNFCGGYRNGSSPCKGDSGGGLALRLGSQERWFFRGIVSYSLNDGTGGCNTRQYTVFTDAAKYTNWILDHIST